MIKKFWNTEKIVSGSAMLISLTTLIVFIYQTNLMRQQQYLSVMPYMMITNQNMGLPNFKLVLTNNGIGPAFVESIRIKYDGQWYPTDFPGFLYDNIPAMDSIDNILHTNIYEGMLIPAGEKLFLLEVGNSEEDAKKLIQLLIRLNEKQFDYELIYRSVYDERWKLTGGSTIPEKMD